MVQVSETSQRDGGMSCFTGMGGRKCQEGVVSASCYPADLGAEMRDSHQRLLQGERI
jgi:hypothetical protein